MGYVIYYVVLFLGLVWDGLSLCEGVILVVRGGIGR